MKSELKNTSYKTYPEILQSEYETSACKKKLNVNNQVSAIIERKKDLMKSLEIAEISS